MSIEEKAVGTVALKVYKAYWLAIGSCLASTILLFVVLMQGMIMQCIFHKQIVVNCSFLTRGCFMITCTIPLGLLAAAAEISSNVIALDVPSGIPPSVTTQLFRYMP